MEQRPVTTEELRQIEEFRRRSMLGNFAEDVLAIVRDDLGNAP